MLPDLASSDGSANAGIYQWFRQADPSVGSGCSEGTDHLVFWVDAMDCRSYRAEEMGAEVSQLVEFQNAGTDNGVDPRRFLESGGDSLVESIRLGLKLLACRPQVLG